MGVKNRSVHLQLRFKRIELLYKPCYKKIIAFLLLAVYCLVAIPAAALHSHAKNANGKKAIVFNNDSNSSVSFSESPGADGVCKICDHQFQLHNDAAVQPSVAIFYFPSAENTILKSSLSLLPRSSHFNKGPPALI